MSRARDGGDADDRLRQDDPEVREEPECEMRGAGGDGGGAKHEGTLLIRPWMDSDDKRLWTDCDKERGREENCDCE